MLHIKAMADTITAAITSYAESKNLSYRNLIGKEYDGVAPLSGPHSGVLR